MTVAGDRLSEGERFVLTTPAGRRKRAEVVAATDLLADALGLSPDAAQELVDKMRQKTDQGLDPKLAKQLRKASGSLIRGLAELDARAAAEPLAIEAPELAEAPAPLELVAKPIAEVPTVETASAPKKPRTQTKGAEPQTATTSPAASVPTDTTDATETRSEEEKNPIQDYLATLQEGTYEGITPEDIPLVADFLVKFSGIMERSNSSNRRGFLSDIMRGKTLRQSARARGVTYGALDQALRKLGIEVRKNLQEGSNLAELINEHLAAVRPGEPEAQSEVIPSSDVKQEVVEQPEGDLEKIREEWLAEQKPKLVEVLIRRGMTAQNAELIWEHLHFGEADANTNQVDTKKQLLTIMRLRIMGTIGVPDLDDNPVGLAAVKKIVHTSLGFNTMDTAFESAQKERPDLTKEEFERLVISAAIELMK